MVDGCYAVLVSQIGLDQGVVDQVEGQRRDVQWLVAEPSCDFLFSSLSVVIKRGSS